MLEIAREIEEGRAAKKQAAAYKEDLDSCYVITEEFKSVNDSLFKAVALNDSIHEKRKEKLANTEEQKDNLEKENKGLEKQVVKEKAQKWTFAGILTVLAAVAAYLGLR